MQKIKCFALFSISGCHSRLGEALSPARSATAEQVAPRLAAGCFTNYLFLFFVFALPIFTATANGLRTAEENRVLPTAMEILEQARAAFPAEPVLIKGQILSGGRLGKLERACYLEIFMELGEDPATIRYKLSDAFGTPFEQMSIIASADGETEFEYESGNPLKPVSAPPPTNVVLETDVAWNDLSLLFLWRSDGRTIRAENLRGRDCYVLAFPEKGGGEKLIWIDTQMMVLLQMEELDREGKLQRRMTVKNIKKISDQWMIKNMEIRSYPSLHHTLIRIDEVISM